MYSHQPSVQRESLQHGTARCQTKEEGSMTEGRYRRASDCHLSQCDQCCLRPCLGQTAATARKSRSAGSGRDEGPLGLAHRRKAQNCLTHLQHGGRGCDVVCRFLIVNGGGMRRRPRSTNCAAVADCSCSRLKPKQTAAAAGPAARTHVAPGCGVSEAMKACRPVIRPV
jgi:hypothetical protein